MYRGTGVSHGVRRTTWDRSLKNWELQIPCFEEFFWGGNTLGLVPASLPHTLGHACTFYAPTSPPPRQVSEFLSPRMLGPNSGVEFIGPYVFEQRELPPKFTLKKFTAQNSHQEIHPRIRAEKFTLHFRRAISQVCLSESIRRTFFADTDTDLSLFRINFVTRTDMASTPFLFSFLPCLVRNLPICNSWEFLREAYRYQYFL